MKVILLENIRSIGSIGDVIEVKRGFARNYLISNKKALYASKENIKEVEKIKLELGKKDQEKKKEAKKIYVIINGKEYIIKKLSTENNELYGSVKPTEISKLILETDKQEIKPSFKIVAFVLLSLGITLLKSGNFSFIILEIIINSFCSVDMWFVPMLIITSSVSLKIFLIMMAPWIIIYLPIVIWTWIHSGSPFGPLFSDIFINKKHKSGIIVMDKIQEVASVSATTLNSDEAYSPVSLSARKIGKNETAVVIDDVANDSFNSSTAFSIVY